MNSESGSNYLKLYLDMSPYFPIVAIEIHILTFFIYAYFNFEKGKIQFFREKLVKRMSNFFFKIVLALLSKSGYLELYVLVSACSFNSSVVSVRSVYWYYPDFVTITLQHHLKSDIVILHVVIIFVIVVVQDSFGHSLPFVSLCDF